jgi:transcriptional regulator with XRE-family HTH domain
MQQMDVNGILERAKFAFGISQDQELADCLSVSRSTVAAWRRRQSIPAKYLSAMLYAGTVSLDWLLTGAGEPNTTNEFGLSDRTPNLDKEILWLALLALRNELEYSNNQHDQRLHPLLTNDMLATFHIWLTDYVTRISDSKEKWQKSGLIKPADMYRALVTEYAVGKFDAPPPPWWEDESII